MATARELLEQVDALMRRNRDEAATADIPVLTDVVTSVDVTPVRDGEALAFPIAPQTEQPLLTRDDESRDERGPDSPSRDERGPDSRTLLSRDERGPDSRTLRALRDELGPDSRTLLPSHDEMDERRWEMLAEDIRMQVLQRIDIFTDTGLQEQLKARLQPIVDSASADLVAAINQHVGQLLRSYVAEAIEREIDKWRQDSG